jgi:predicted Zn-dependent protease
MLEFSSIGDDGGVQIARVATLLLALLACAWFALGARQAHEMTKATNLLESSSSLSSRQLHEAQSWLDSAATLNPDRTVDILRARALIKAGQARNAEQLLESVTRREPLSLEAWIWLAGSALGDPPVARRALAHIDTLDPRARQS